MSTNSELALAISISIFALFITLMFSLYPPVIKENLYWRKPLIGSIFTLICISGIIAVFHPKQCSESLSLPKIKAKENFSDKDNAFVNLKGHHPDCGKFSPHIIHVKDKSFCAACTGLLLGALIAIAGTALYFFTGWNLGQGSFLFVWIGQIGVIFGFIQFKFKGYARLAVNAFFVVSALLVLAGVDMLAENLFIDLFLIGITIFWLFTRILISKWNNQRICFSCDRCEIKEG
jgi:hypothetical protein